MLRVGPLVTTLGLSLTVPLGLLSDSLYKHIHFSPLFYVGTALVLTGFVVVVLYKHRSRPRPDTERMLT